MEGEEGGGGSSAAGAGGPSGAAWVLPPPPPGYRNAVLPPPPEVWDFTGKGGIDLVFLYAGAGKWEAVNSAIVAGFPLRAVNSSDGATLLHVAVARVRGYNMA
jgi:hypothetical protein